jgi:MOSC domain-containing protein YiiM
MSDTHNRLRWTPSRRTRNNERMLPNRPESPVRPQRDSIADFPTAGRVEAIHIAPTRGAPMEAVQRSVALAGLGLEGDRYTRLAADGSSEIMPDRHLTLIEAEQIDRLATDHGIYLAPGETRRNVTTRGIRLNTLVGRRFRVGPVECQTMALCEPCRDLVAIVGKPVLAPLVHRAGVTARILTGGEIAVGDEIVPLI